MKLILLFTTFALSTATSTDFCSQSYFNNLTERFELLEKNLDYLNGYYAKIRCDSWLSMSGRRWECTELEHIIGEQITWKKKIVYQMRTHRYICN